MKDKLNALKPKLKSPVVTHLAALAGGAIAVYATHYLYQRFMVDNAYTLILGKEAAEALINDETNFIRFTSDKHEHAFRVTLEQWI